jgi:hypothetical protein
MQIALLQNGGIVEQFLVILDMSDRSSQFKKRKICAFNWAYSQLYSD